MRKERQIGKPGRMAPFMNERSASSETKSARTTEITEVKSLKSTPKFSETTHKALSAYQRMIAGLFVHIRNVVVDDGESWKAS